MLLLCSAATARPKAITSRTKTIIRINLEAIDWGNCVLQSLISPDLPCYLFSTQLLSRFSNVSLCTVSLFWLGFIWVTERKLCTGEYENSEEEAKKLEREKNFSTSFITQIPIMPILCSNFKSVMSIINSIVQKNKSKKLSFQSVMFQPTQEILSLWMIWMMVAV